MAARLLVAGPLDFSQLRVRWEKTPVCSAEVEDFLAPRWQAFQTEASAAGKTIFNGPVALLLSHRMDGKNLELTLAAGEYRNYLLSTNLERPWFEQHAPSQIYTALGNSILLTHQGRGVVGLRSSRVACYPSHGHLFGGIFDRIAPASGPEELMAHLETELAEELHLSLAELTAQPRICGLFWETRLQQPELVWHAELAVSPHELQNRLDLQEHARLVLLEHPAETPVPLTPVTQAAWVTLQRN